MHGREHPWHIRRVSHRHLHDQLNLKDFHLLTQAWEPKGLPNPFDQEPSLEDDTWPEDVLGRLELAVRAIQLRAIQGAARADAGSLAERSYQAGQDAAARRWTQADPTEGSIAPADKRALLLALYHSPLGGRLGPAAFLVRRSLVTEVTVELLQCPHRLAESHGAEIDELCTQQFHWLRGYFGYLNPALTPAITRVPGRPHSLCRVSW